MNVDKRLEQSIKKLREAALDIREIPDQVGKGGDPNHSADQVDGVADALENIREMLVTGRGTGGPDSP
jgi:hypothetical protein